MRSNTTVVRGWKKMSIGVVVAASLLAAPVTVASVSSSTVSHATYASSATAGAPDVRVNLGSAAAPIAPQLALPSDVAEKRGWIGPLINWIKKNAAGIWNGLVKAVKNGWNAFVRWWNSLAVWIRGAINFIVQGGLWEMFAGLWDYFF